MVLIGSGQLDVLGYFVGDGHENEGLGQHFLDGRYHACLRIFGPVHQSIIIQLREELVRPDDERLILDSRTCSSSCFIPEMEL